MRKSSVRTLRQEYNARERALSRESQREMTDVVVYLRGQDLSPLDQEEIRRDILEMVWEAEARGETMAQVVGQDYRTFFGILQPLQGPAGRFVTVGMEQGVKEL